MLASALSSRFRLPLKRLRCAGTLCLSLTLCALHPSKALTEGEYWTDNSTGLAIGGFDPVSFFTQTKAQRGVADHELVWRGAYWQFSNKGNLAAFRRDPEVYAPQFGGNGALALSRGFRSAANPLVWHITQGKLYLFHSNENKMEWLAMRDVDRDQAVVNWARLK